MRNSRFLPYMVAVCALLVILLSPSIAKADPVCPAHTALPDLVSLVPCTIGDKTFTFGPVQFSTLIRNSAGIFPFAASNFLLVPDGVSDPLNPTFSIIGSNAIVLRGTNADATLSMSFTASTTDGSASLAGIDLSLAAYATDAGPNIADTIQAVHSSNLVANPLVLCVQDGGPSLLPGCVSGQPNDASASFATPVSSESGTVTLLWSDDDLGEVGFTNAILSFHEIPTATPEPGSLLLLGTGCLGALGVVGRRGLR